MGNTNVASAASQGIFITFEGGDGAGKTTHVRFLEACLVRRGVRVVRLREPGGTSVGEQLRDIVLNPENDALSSESELLIYEAARAQAVTQVVKPALEAGAVVLADRFFDSTTAYQAYGRGLSLDFVKRANAFACQGVVPTRTLLLQVAGGAAENLHRAECVSAPDRMELAGLDFQQRVLAGFQAIAEAEPNRVRVVASYPDAAQTARGVFAALSDLFPWMADPAVCDDAFFAQINEPAVSNGQV